jgi:CBS domain-containing protein
MRIRDVMTSPVVMVDPDHHLKDVARLLLGLRIGAVPVVEEDGRLVGMLSEADLVSLEAVPDPRAHALPTSTADAAPVPVTVRQLMTGEVTTLREEDDVAEAARLMVGSGHRCIPVVAGDRVVGIVARQDLLRVLARDDDDVRAELQALLDELADVAAPYRVDVADGVATLTGPAGAASRQLPEVLARTVPGVIGIRFAEDPATTGA